MERRCSSSPSLLSLRRAGETFLTAATTGRERERRDFTKARPIPRLAEGEEEEEEEEEGGEEEEEKEE